MASRRAPAGSARKDAPLDAGRFYAAACRAHDVGDLPASVTLYTTALQLDATLLEAWIGRGVAHKESRDFNAAISDYSRALALSTNDKTTLLVLSNRANAYTAAGETKSDPGGTQFRDVAACGN
jgi:tetratricopeptide (TPR) repeat protein